MKIIFPLLLILITIILFGKWYFSSQDQLLYYYSPNCPHCVKFMPEWETINLPITKKKINCMVEKCPNIEYLPTLILKTNNKNISYDGERKKDDIENFVFQNIKN